MDQANWGWGSRSLLANNKITIDVDDTALDELQVPGSYPILFYFVFCALFFFFQAGNQRRLGFVTRPN